MKIVDRHGNLLVKGDYVRFRRTETDSFSRFGIFQYQRISTGRTVLNILHGRKYLSEIEKYPDNVEKITEEQAMLMMFEMSI